MDLAEAADAEVLGQLLGRPRRHPDLPAEGVDRLDGRHEVVVAGDEHRDVERPDRRVLDDVGDEPRVHALLGRVFVVAAARRASPGAAYARLALDEVAGPELEALQEAFDQGRRVGGETDVVVGPAEDRGRATHGVGEDRKSTRLNSSHVAISYAVF